MSELTVTIACKKKDGKAFKTTDDVWYNVREAAMIDLKTVDKGDVITITVEKKGTASYVTELINGAVKKEAKETPTTADGSVCEVCGKPVKDGFKKCYTCNKTKATKSEETVENDVPKCTVCGKVLKNPKYPTCYTCKAKVPKTEKKQYVSYDNPEKTARIQRGNALNASAVVASGQSFVTPDGAPDVDGARQYTLMLAEAFLEWLRAE